MTHVHVLTMSVSSLLGGMCGFYGNGNIDQWTRDGKVASWIPDTRGGRIFFLRAYFGIRFLVVMRRVKLIRLKRKDQQPACMEWFQKGC